MNEVLKGGGGGGREGGIETDAFTGCSIRE